MADATNKGCSNSVLTGSVEID